MRIEAGIAFSISTALHAGIILLAPGIPVARDSAALVSMPPAVITARLKNTLDAGKLSGFRTLKSARAVRSAGRNSAAIRAGRNVRVAHVARKGQRLDSLFRFYPPEAIRQGLEGEAIVMLRLGGDGGVLAAQIAKSSGYLILDEAALRAIRATPRFSPGPREIMLPVTFALR